MKKVILRSRLHLPIVKGFASVKEVQQYHDFITETFYAPVFMMEVHPSIGFRQDLHYGLYWVAGYKPTLNQVEILFEEGGYTNRS